MKRKINIVDITLKVMIIDIIVLGVSLILMGIFSNTTLEDFFGTIFVSTMYVLLFVILTLIFGPIIFGEEEVLYTSDLKKLPKEFEEFYKITYEKHIVKLEKIRIPLMLKIILGRITTLLLIIGIPLIDYMRFSLRDHSLLIFMVLSGWTSFLFLIILRILLYKNTKAHKLFYKTKYKETVINDLVHTLNNQVTYEATNADKIDFYRGIFQVTNKNIFKMSDARVLFNAEDFIEGEIDSCLVRICTLSELYRPPKEKINYFSRNYTRGIMYSASDFEGMFAYVNCFAKMKPNFIISRKSIINHYNNNEKVNINNDEFNKYFNVYSKESNYVKKLLEVGFAEILLKFREDNKADFDIFYVNGKIYIKIYCFSVFEPDALDTTRGKKSMYTQYCFVQFIIDLIKEINIALD